MTAKGKKIVGLVHAGHWRAFSVLPGSRRQLDSIKRKKNKKKIKSIKEKNNDWKKIFDTKNCKKFNPNKKNLNLN